MANIASQFRQFDARPGTADGFKVRIERVIKDDDNGNSRPRLFENDVRREGWEDDRWHYVGIIARGHVSLVVNGTGITFTLDSAGLWGIESDSGEAYFAEVFQEECDTLRRMLDDMRSLPLTIEVMPA